MNFKLYMQSVGGLFDNRLISSLIFLIPSIILFALLLKGGMPFCCSAENYIESIKEFQNNGLLAKIPFLGYRSYLFPYVYSLFPINLIKSISIFGAFMTMYSFFAMILFLIVEFFVIYILQKTKYFKIFYISFFLNPFLLMYIPYPLQESFLVLLVVLFIPLMFVAYVQKKQYILIILLGLFFSTMYMDRPSHVLLLIPILGFSIYIVFNATVNKLLLSLVFVVSLLSFVVPQSFISYKYFGTVNPYSKTSVLEFQFKYGNVYSKYGTNLSGNENIGVEQVYWNPLACKTQKSSEHRDSRTIQCSTDNNELVTNLTSFYQTNTSKEMVFKSVLHIFNILNYDYLKPYAVKKTLTLFAWHQILSMLIVFFGFYAILKKYTQRSVTAFDIFLDGMLYITIGTVFLFAVETRFGLLATIILSYKTVELFLYNRPQKNEFIPLIFGAVMFTVTSSLLSIYIASFSGALT